jgi:hypothetical protein
VAEATQIGAMMLAGGAVWRAFHSNTASASRAAVLLAAPHAGGYDLLPAAASGLFLSHLGSRADGRDWFLGLLVWFAPWLVYGCCRCQAVSVKFLQRRCWDAFCGTHGPRRHGQGVRTLGRSRAFSP